MELSSNFKAFGQLSPSQHLEWASRRLPPWISLALVLALAWLLADLVWTVWPRGDTGSGGVAATAVPARAPGKAAGLDASALKNANLFGSFQASDAAVAPVEQVVDAPETRLRLVLKGTVADKNQEGAFAIIGESGKSDDKVYWVGDSIPGNASLYSVHPDKVILRRAGKLETLTLKTLLDKSPNAATRTPSRTVARNSQAPDKSQNMRQLRQQLIENPAQITDIIRPQPVYANGRQMGYRVYPGRDRQKFVELGLRPGDLVTEINGTALTDPAQGQQLLRQITQSDVINLTIQRSGQTETLTLRMDE